MRDAHQRTPLRVSAEERSAGAVENAVVHLVDRDGRVQRRQREDLAAPADFGVGIPPRMLEPPIDADQTPVL